MIDQATIEDIRSRTSIVGLIAETVKLARRGRSHVGCCPFHNERTPSFYVHEERGFFHCFGCRESGDAVAFVQKINGMSFPEAVRLLASRVGITIEETAGPSDEQRSQREAELGALGLAATFFEKMLVEHPSRVAAQQELERRHVGEAAVKSFRLGYAPDEWSALADFFRFHGVSPNIAERVGLLVPRERGGYYDRFRSRLMFPIFDREGRVVAFSGRILEDRHGKVDTETGKYVNSPETAHFKKGASVYGLHQARAAIRELDQAVVVEGNFDVVSLHAAGIRNVVAPLGTAFTEAQAQALRRFSPNIVLLFDGDDAGERATDKALETVRAAKLSARAATIPRGLDPDELVRAEGAEGVRRVIAGAVGLLEHVVSVALRGIETLDMEARVVRLSQIARTIAEEDDPAIRAVGDLVAAETVAKAGIPSPAAPRIARAIGRAILPARRERRLSVVEGVLGCFLDYPEILDDPAIQAALGQPTGSFVDVAPLLRLPRAEMLAGLPEGLRDFAVERTAAPVHLSAIGAREEALVNIPKLRHDQGPPPVVDTTYRARFEALARDRAGR